MHNELAVFLHLPPHPVRVVKPADKREIMMKITIVMQP